MLTFLLSNKILLYKLKLLVLTLRVVAFVNPQIDWLSHEAHSIRPARCFNVAQSQREKKKMLKKRKFIAHFCGDL